MHTGVHVQTRECVVFSVQLTETSVQGQIKCPASSDCSIVPRTCVITHNYANNMYWCM